MKVYVVSYDVSDDRVRRQIAKLLRKHGERVQYSVFEVRLRSYAQLEKLYSQLKKFADEDTNIRLYETPMRLVKSQNG